MKKTLHLLLCPLLSLTSTLALGQEAEPDTNDGPRWFQVEVAIFSQQHAGDASQEHWRKDIALAYPPNWVELRSPETFLAQQLQLEQAQAEREAFERSMVEAIPPESDGELPASHESTDDANDLMDSSIDSDTLPPDESALEIESPPRPAIDLEREPYFFLPKEQHQLSAEVAQLRRNKRYRVLFHQAWRQPVVELAKAPALLIEGGEAFGQYRELEGSLTLSVSRYLHLRTNLWLSQFVTNYGQESADWPDLPVRPDKLSDADNGPLAQAAEHGLWSALNSGAGEYESILAQPYLVDQVVTMEQKRRMRSGELHYIDHPLMGVLVKVTRYEVPPEAIPGDEENSEPSDSENAMASIEEAGGEETIDEETIGEGPNDDDSIGSTVRAVPFKEKSDSATAIE